MKKQHELYSTINEYLYFNEICNNIILDNNYISLYHEDNNECIWAFENFNLDTFTKSLFKTHFNISNENDLFKFTHENIKNIFKLLYRTIENNLNFIKYFHKSLIHIDQKIKENIKIDLKNLNVSFDNLNNNQKKNFEKLLSNNINTFFSINEFKSMFNNLDQLIDFILIDIQNDISIDIDNLEKDKEIKFDIFDKKFITTIRTVGIDVSENGYNFNSLIKNHKATTFKNLGFNNLDSLNELLFLFDKTWDKFLTIDTLDKNLNNFIKELKKKESYLLKNDFDKMKINTKINNIQNKIKNSIEILAPLQECMNDILNQFDELIEVYFHNINLID